MNEAMIRNELKSQKGSVEALIQSDEKLKKSLERSVPVMLLFAIVEVMLLKAGMMPWFIVIFATPVLIGCSIHSAMLIRSCDKRLERSEQNLKDIKTAIKTYEERSEP